MECDIPQFYATETRKARKSYSCCECGANIDVGEEYLICKGKWGGDFQYWRQHLLCAEACMSIRDEFEGECIGFGCLWEWWGENHDNVNRAATEMPRIAADTGTQPQTFGVHPLQQRHDKAIKLRSMIARIKWRERTGKRTK